MRASRIAAAIAVASAACAPAYAATQLVKLPECQVLTEEALHELAVYALTKRRYNIQEDTPGMVVGELEKKIVEIVITPQNLVIRFRPGFENTKNDQWLRNLKTDVLWRLAE